MLIEFFPDKQTPPRKGGWWINGVKLIPSRQNLNDNDYKAIKDTETFKEFLAQGIIVVGDESPIVETPKEEVKQSVVKEVITPEPTPSPVVTPPKPSKPKIDKKWEDLTQAEAISLVSSADNFELLDQYKEDETATKQRKAVYDAIANKVKALEQS
jgi:hypothetical protein